MRRASFHLLAKPTGAVCNLDCKYCFFLSKEMLYPGSRFQMADDLLETYIRQLLESQSGPEVIVGWQGGEPTLMGVDFYRRSVEYVRKYQRPGQQVEYTFQTNGVLIDEESGWWLGCLFGLRAMAVDTKQHPRLALLDDRGIQAHLVHVDRAEPFEDPAHRRAPGAAARRIDRA